MMIEEAIMNINALNAVCGQKDFWDYEFEKALEMAIEALKKQIPKKPRFVDVKFCKYTFAYCPNCNLCFGETKPKMCAYVRDKKMLMRSEKMCSCEKCGQRIDFTEEGAEE